MGEYGAHLVSLSVNTPSIFEVLAEENLQTALRPAFEYFVKFIIDKYPDSDTYLKHYNEVFLALDLIIQHHFLKHYGSSFAENFYGLKRLPLNPNDVKNTRNILRKSLIFLVIFPYVKLLLAKKFQFALETQADGIKHKHEQLLNIFLFIYPLFHFGLESVVFYSYFAFTLGKIKTHSPFVYLSGSRLVVDPQTDANIRMQSHFPKIPAKSFKKIISTIFQVAVDNFVVGLTWSLSIGAFFIQFLEWCNKCKRENLTNYCNYTPPAPIVNQLTVKIDPRICPLCLKSRTNDTALTTSGYVFCYRCIHQYVQQHCACPITKYLSNLTHLIRLYPPSR